MTNLINSGPNTINILVAEDDPMDVDLLKMAMSVSDWETPFKLYACSDGQKLLDYLQANPDKRVDLMILDINMPRLDGISTLKRIRFEANWADVPVILYSSVETEAGMRKYFYTGADDFFEKPMDPKGYLGLVDKMQNLLSRQQVSHKNEPLQASA